MKAISVKPYIKQLLNEFLLLLRLNYFTVGYMQVWKRGHMAANTNTLRLFGVGVKEK